MLTVKSLLINIINLSSGVVGFFLGFRIIFLILGVNTATPIVSWIYQVSANLEYPFRGIVGNTGLTTGGAIDWVAVISLLFYLILGNGLISLVSILTNMYLSNLDQRNAAHYHTIRKKEPVIYDQKEEE